MQDKQTAAPENTAVRVALWRALHVQVDAPPHVLEDEIGLQSGGARRTIGAAVRTWTRRLHAPLPRLHRGACALHRGSGRGAGWPRRQPVRHPRRRPRHFCPAQAGDRLALEGLRGRPARSSGVEAAAPDRAWLRHSGVAAARAGRLRGGRRMVGAAGGGRLRCKALPAVVASTGVSMYLTKEAIAATLRQVAALAPGSTLAMTFLLPLELDGPGGASRTCRWRRRAREQRNAVPQLLHPGRRCWRWPAKPASERPGTCRQPTLSQRYFDGRTDGLRLGSSEELLVATT